MKKYEFSNREFEKEYGKSPRGTGHWAFIIFGAAIENIAPETYVDSRSTFQKETIFWVPGVWTLTEAKKRAAVMLEANAVPFGTTVYIAP